MNKGLPKEHLADASSLLSKAEIGLMVGGGGIVQINCHMAIDRCCAAIYSIFAELPSGFGDRAGQILLNFCESSLKNKAEISPEILNDIKLLAKNAINYGSCSMHKISPSSMASLKNLMNVAKESIVITDKILKFLD